MMFNHIKTSLRCVIIAVAFVSAGAHAQTIELKLAFFSSDRSLSYRAAVKPFVDAVNSDGRDLVKIVPHFSGSLGKDMTDQAELVLDGRADIAYVVTGLARQRFSDNAIVEMPGLFDSMREATLAFTHLTAAEALRGYEDYFVIGAYVTEPEMIHSRSSILTLADLKGARLRVNNQGEAAALDRFGATPVLMPVNKISEAISSGSIDGAAVSLSPLLDYGIKRVATHHYLLPVGGASLALLMNRERFESLPEPVQLLVRKYSGMWAAEHFIATYAPADAQIMEDLKSDPKRNAVSPSPEDLQTARRVFASIREEWAAENSYNRDLLVAVGSELAKLRAGH